MVRMSPVLGLALCFLLPAVPVQAQFAVGADGGYYTLTGDDFEGTDAGFGFGGFLRYVLPAGFRIGGGVQFNSHDVDGIDPNLSVLSIHLEPGYQFNIPNAPTFKPFLAARGLWARQKISEAGDELKATGFAFGGVAGVLFQLAPQFAIEPSVAYYVVNFGDFELNGTTIADTDTNGGSLGLKLAFVVNFGPS